MDVEADAAQRLDGTVVLGDILDREERRAHGKIAGTMSVRLKSLPLNNKGSPEDLASA